MISLTIDGRPVEVPEGTTVLQAAQLAGVHVPTLCHHPALTPSGGCRLCIVEIQGFRGPTASCTLPASQGMIVQTDTPTLRTSRKFVLDMLFSERNHFCPFCQVSGGDCELQNAAYNEGMTQWDFQPLWKHFEVDASHPNFVLDHNRCILCRRCIRACAELVGNYTLTASERGSATLITADYGLPLGESTCVSCGMCVQVCPTGALIDRSSAYKGHAKDWQATQTTCVGCSVGCSTVVWERDNQLVRIEGDWEGPVNQGLTCRNGRFEPFDQAQDRTRLTQPLARKDGQLQPVTWEEALSLVRSRLQALAGQNGRGVAALASTRLPVEDLALFRRLFAGGLVTGIEEGLTTAAASALAAELGRPFEAKLDALKAADLLLAVGVDLGNNHQVAGFQIKRRTDGMPVMVIDPGENAMKTWGGLNLQPQPGQDAALIEAVRQGLKGAAVFETGGVSAAQIGQMVEELRAAMRPAIVYGKGVTAQSSAALKALVGLCDDLRALGKTPALVGVKGEANSLAAAQLGLDQPFAVNGQQMAFLALSDDFPSQRLMGRVANLPFKVALAAYASPLTDLADVVLPVTTWAEQGGHYLNLDGRLQEAKAVLQAPQGVRPTHAVLTELAVGLNVNPLVDWKAALNDRVAPVALELN